LEIFEHIAAADGGSNETSNDTSSALVSRTALAIWNDTLDGRPTDAASDVIVRNSSQEPTWTSVVGLTIPESTGDGTNMATDEAVNSTMKTIIVDCDRGNSKICDNFYSRPVISRRNDNDDDFVGRKIATSDDDDEDRENLVEMVHPCLDNVACENGGMFLSMSDGRCGCLCPT
uniref:Uncharacterized protein n=1 Tax=Romanomermis culicivorax TaxID=13658 RepID=A0A915HSP3_ROMCU